MTGKAQHSTLSSRPKIHKLPAARSRSHKKSIFTRVAQSLIMASGVGLAIALSIVFLSGVVGLIQPNNSGLKPPPAQASNGSSDTRRLVWTPKNAAAAKNDKMIVIEGEEGSIVGQMAKISGETEQMSEIKSMSEVDNRTGRDLLSILNKY